MQQGTQEEAAAVEAESEDGDTVGLQGRRPGAAGSTEHSAELGSKLDAGVKGKQESPHLAQESFSFIRDASSAKDKVNRCSTKRW